MGTLIFMSDAGNLKNFKLYILLNIVYFDFQSKSYKSYVSAFLLFFYIMEQLKNTKKIRVSQ